MVSKADMPSTKRRYEKEKETIPKKCSLCKVGENKAGASGAVCTADEYTADKGCQDCLLAGGKPTDKTWCKNWAGPVQACADCVATEGSTWCELCTLIVFVKFIQSDCSKHTN